MAGGVDAEAVDSHLDELAVALHNVVGDGRVLGVQVHAVAGNLSPPAVGQVPVPVCRHVVPVVLAVVVLSVGVLQVLEARVILLVGWYVPVCFAAEYVRRVHTGLDVGLILDVLVALIELAEEVFAEVAGVLEHDVEDYLQPLGVSGIDKALEGNVLRCSPLLSALVAKVYRREVHGVVAVVVVARSVLHNRCNPDSSEAESLDVVELVDESLEVTTPAWVLRGNLRLLVVPAKHVVCRVAIVEASGNDEVDGFVTEVSTGAVEVVSQHWGELRAAEQ